MEKQNPFNALAGIAKEHPLLRATADIVEFAMIADIAATMAPIKKDKILEVFAKAKALQKEAVILMVDEPIKYDGSKVAKLMNEALTMIKSEMNELRKEVL